MLNIGPQELLLILVVALVVVGPQRLPELSRSIGKALRSLRAAQDEMRKTVNEVLEPQVIGEATKDLRSARDEVREALRPDRAGARGAPTTPTTPPGAPTPKDRPTGTVPPPGDAETAPGDASASEAHEPEATA